MWISVTVYTIHIATKLCFSKHISNDVANNMTQSSSLVGWLEAEVCDKYLNSRLWEIVSEHATFEFDSYLHIRHSHTQFYIYGVG
jgi:hypothetical protein